MPKYRLRVMVEEIIEAEDDVQAREILDDMFTHYLWQVAELERLDDDAADMG